MTAKVSQWDCRVIVVRNLPFSDQRLNGKIIVFLLYSGFIFFDIIGGQWIYSDLFNKTHDQGSNPGFDAYEANIPCQLYGFQIKPHEQGSNPGP